MRNNSVKLFEFEPVVQEMSFEDISYLELFLGVAKPFGHFGRGHHEEHFFEIILNLNQWFRRCGLKT